MMPQDAVLAVTWRCNARCEMCGIWKVSEHDELPASAYAGLPSSLRDINLTGGEPFLRADLPALHETILRACPRARTVISSNGIFTQRILAQTREISRAEPNVGIAISIDGPTDVHDEQRGIRGAYDKALATLKALGDAGVRNLRLAFTATPRNAAYLGAMYALAQELGVEFTCAVVHSSEHYFHSTGDVRAMPIAVLREEIQLVMKGMLRTFSPKQWARAYFMKGLYDFAAGRGRPLPCRAGRDFFFMDPSGNVFTCNAAPFRMGNLKESSFNDLWNSPEAEESRRKALECGTGCWMVCTARTSIKRAWPRVLAWAIARKTTGVSLPEDAP